MSEPEVVTAEVAEVDVRTAAPQGTPCRACGCPVESGERFCSACGAAVEGTGADATPRVGVETPRSARYFRCQGCGSEVSVDPDQRSYVCAFCESSYVVEFSPEESGRQSPEFVIGFAVPKEHAQSRFREWLASGRWFRPGDLARAAVVDRLRGVYLPFWTFSMRADSSWDAQIGEYWYRTETYTEKDAQGNTVTKTRQVRETEWWDLSGRHHRYYSGYLVSASRGLSQQEADSIGPFQLPALRRYEPYYLAGWACEEYSVAAAEALEQCQREFYRREQGNVAAFLPGDTHANLRVQTSFRGITSDLCLLPVHLLTYRYGGKAYRFLVNGQTGRVVGERPISWKRVLVFVALAMGVTVLAALGIAALAAANR